MVGKLLINIFFFLQENNKNIRINKFILNFHKQNVNTLLYRIMKTPRGDQINIKVEELKDKFKNYLSPLFEEWKRVVPIQIQENIVQPLFTINKNNTISLNFSEEVIIFLIHNK